MSLTAAEAAAAALARLELLGASRAARRGLERALSAGRRQGFTSVSFAGVRFSWDAAADGHVPAAGCSKADRWSADRRQAPDGGSAHVMSENFVQAREEGARQAPAPTPAQVRRKARKDEDFAGKQRARRHRLGRVFGAFRAATVAATRQRALGSRARDVMLSPAAAALAGAPATGDAARADRQSALNQAALHPPEEDMRAAGKRGAMGSSSSGGAPRQGAGAGPPGAKARRGGASRKVHKAHSDGGGAQLSQADLERARALEAGFAAAAAAGRSADPWR